MKAVVQRVSVASVEVDGKIVGQIGRGLLVYLGVATADNDSDALFIAEKIANLRIFADDAGKMNRSVRDIAGQVLLVSNFTLQAIAAKVAGPVLTPPPNPKLPNSCMKKLLTSLLTMG